MARDLREALDQIEAQLSQGDGDAILQALRRFRPQRFFESGREDLRRCFALLYELLDLTEGKTDDVSRMISSIAISGLESMFQDPDGARREFGARSRARALALRGDFAEGLDHQSPTAAFLPFTTAEAAELAAPYLKRLEADLETRPQAHFRICWQALDCPMPPFDRVFRNWLQGLSQRHAEHPDGLEVLERAMAFNQLAQSGRQHLSWPAVEQDLLVQLHSSHPLVAANLARFLGDLWADGSERLHRGEPWPLPGILNHIAGLGANRRAVAGGFLNGLADTEDPFVMLREHPEMAGFDLEDWVLRVFADMSPEPYLPGAQAFWFYVHEYYWNAPDFVLRLLDAGHEWEALMCATEAPWEKGSGMQPALETLASRAKPEIAEAARASLARHFPDS